MAERKSLIRPEAQASSTLARILQRDRSESGRTDFDVVPEAAGRSQTSSQPNESLEADVGSHLAGNVESLEQKPLSPRIVTSPRAEVSVAKPKSHGAKAERKRQIEEMADTALVSVTLRLPEALNDWLDTVAFQRRKEGVYKQDLIAEALVHFILSKESGE